MPRALKTAGKAAAKKPKLVAKTAALPAPAATTAAASSGLATRIASLFELNRQRKELERQEAELKEWFKAEADGKDFEFSAGDFFVKVTKKTTERLEKQAVLDLIGEKKLAACMKTSEYVEVAVGKLKGAA